MSGVNQAEQAGSLKLAAERDPGRDPGDAPSGRPARRNRWRRIALISVGSVLALAVVTAAGGYVVVNHFASNVKRIPNAFSRLDAVNRPVLPAATAKSMTILLTGSQMATGPGGPASTTPQDPSGLIALVHFNAGLKAGSVVSIPANAEVNIPGYGRSRLEDALQFGGPALLIATVQQLTDVPIDHYSVVDFNGLSSTLGPLGGVNVDLPEATLSDGVYFHAGSNHLTAATALAYVRGSNLTEEERVLRQQALLRAIVSKLAAENLIADPLKDARVLNAFTSALSVDSDFTNAGLMSLAKDLHLLRPGSSTFVTAPVRSSAVNNKPVQFDTAVADELWKAIRNDSVAAFAAEYPDTVTPIAPK